MEPSAISITTPMLESLRGTRRWVKLVAVLLAISGSLTMLGSLIINVIDSPEQKLPAAMRVAMSGTYLLFGAVYWVLAVYLWRYGRAIKLLDSELAYEHLEDALEQQRKFWRMVGVIAVCFVVIALLGMTAAIVIPMLAGR